MNPIGLNGIEFIEFASPHPELLHHLFLEFGFSRTHKNEARNQDLYVQHDIHLILNQGKDSHASSFAQAHGPSIPSMGWRVKNAQSAFETAVLRGATPAQKSDFFNHGGKPIPALEGIGGSLIYLIEDQTPDLYATLGFTPLAHPDRVPSLGFTAIDHLTNNVQHGTMNKWGDFYKNIFGFTEVRYFDIRGVKTGLQSYALQSPCGKFCIPINEANEAKSQINEYIDEYRGPGIQHLAFLTEDILSSIEGMRKTSIQTLDIDSEYYQTVFDRVKNVSEDRQKLKDYQILVDGDDEGYLLQIFTKNLVGPIFVEIIQRKNHRSFGEGNFGALFRSIERDQEKRGVFQA